MSYIRPKWKRKIKGNLTAEDLKEFNSDVETFINKRPNWIHDIKRDKLNKYNR